MYRLFWWLEQSIIIDYLQMKHTTKIELSRLLIIKSADLEYSRRHLHYSTIN